MLRSRTVRRRVLAALVLFGFAIGSSLFWNEWRVDWPSLSINLLAAGAGLLFLHNRWRIKEARAMTPRKIKDTFS
ncbi:MAG: hypothetical protein AAF697_02170 [Pseudomonadota bacterium]